jgi:hypothetical protein
MKKMKKIHVSSTVDGRKVGQGDELYMDIKVVKRKWPSSGVP